MVMTESPIRRACNRCHAQKLSCKRSGDEPCERCIRLKTECKSSPSLRYRKNQAPTGITDSSSRPPKRRRVCEEAALAQDESEAETRDSSGDMIQLTMNQVSASGVGLTQPYPAMDLINFRFDFGVPDIYNPSANNIPVPQPFFRRQGMDGITDLLDSEGIVDPWSHHHPGNSSPRSEADLFSPDPGETSKQRPTHHSQHNSLSLLPTPDQQEAPHTFLGGQLFAPTARRRIMLKSSPRQTTPEARWLAEISDINSKLLDVAGSVPILTETVDDTEIYTNSPPGYEDSSSSPMFSIDSMFKLSRRFINTVQEITRSVTSASSATTSTRHAPKAEHQLDTGSSLLILSTYVRILELYQKVFRLVNVELSSTSGKEPLQLCKLPDVSLGSFQVVSSQNLQMILTIRLAEDFLAELRGILASLDSTSSAASPDNPSSLFSGVVSVSSNEVTEREKQIQRDLSTMRARLEI